MCGRNAGGACARGMSCETNPQQTWDTAGMTNELIMIAENCVMVGAVVVRMSMDRPGECECSDSICTTRSSSGIFNSGKCA